MSYIRFFMFSPKRFSESSKLSFTPNSIYSEQCNSGKSAIWLSGRGPNPTPTRLFTTEKLIFSLWNQVFWLSFASLWEVLMLSRLAKLNQKFWFHKEKISFSMVKSLVGVGFGPRPRPGSFPLLQCSLYIELGVNLVLNSH